MKEYSLKKIYEFFSGIIFLFFIFVLVSIYFLDNYFIINKLEKDLFDSTQQSFLNWTKDISENNSSLNKKSEEVLKHVTEKLKLEINDELQKKTDITEKKITNILNNIDATRNFDISKDKLNFEFYIINERGTISLTSDHLVFQKNISSDSELWNKLQILEKSEIYITENSDHNEKSFISKNSYTYLSNNTILKVNLLFENEMSKYILNQLDTLKQNFFIAPKINVFNSDLSPMYKETSSLSLEDKKQILNNEKDLISKFSGNDLIYYYHNPDISEFYFKIIFNLSILERFKFIILVPLILLGILIFLTLIISYKLFYDKIALPFTILAYNMKNFSDTKVFIDDNSYSKSQIKELNEITNAYMSLGDEITASMEELTATNDSLQEAFERSEDLSNKFETILHLSSKLVTDSNKKEDDFFEEVLGLAKNLIPEADFGSIYTISAGNIVFKATIGHNQSMLNSLGIKKDYFFRVHSEEMDKNQYTNSFIIDNIQSRSRNNMPEKIQTKYKKATMSVKSSLVFPLIMDGKIFGGLTLDIGKNSNSDFSIESKKIIEGLGNMLASFIINKEYNKKQERFQTDLITSIINLLEIHDEYTKGHSENVAVLSRRIAQQLDFDLKKSREIFLAGLIHDIGKIVIDRKILNKTGPLNDHEYQIIKRHPEFGYKTLKHSKKLKNLAKYIKYHHERFDGKGYPDGLSGMEIPLVSRIISVADSWDAMTSRRSYREPLPKEVALTEIIKNRGSQFDPDIVDAFLKIIVESDDFK
ncbi:MAG: HD domain-containing phosphohydrolase [Fusobacteriota bacterium]